MELMMNQRRKKVPSTAGHPSAISDELDVLADHVSIHAGECRFGSIEKIVPLSGVFRVSVD
jgi:hypothetical protein